MFHVVDCLSVLDRSRTPHFSYRIVKMLQINSHEYNFPASQSEIA